MAIRLTKVASLLLMGSLIIVGLLALSGAIPSLTSKDNSVSLPAAQVNRFPFGVGNLKGASPEEIGRYAIEYVQHQQIVPGTPQLLLTRAIKPDDLPQLGLGCPIEMASIEEPPLDLVILKGDFDIRQMGASVGGGGEYHYIAYVFDEWSARHIIFQASRDGSAFRTALNDTTLPVGSSLVGMECPTAIPAKKTLHYGDVAPTPLPPDLPEASPIPTSLPLPTAVGTEGIR